MATCKVSNQFNEEHAAGEHDLVTAGGAGNLIAILLDTSFGTFDPATHGQYTDISANEIATGFGYTQKTKALTTVSVDQVTSVMTLNADDLTWTASGDDIETCKACAIINDAHDNDTIICCIEFGANYATADGTSLSIGLSNGLVKWTANPA